MNKTATTLLTICATLTSLFAGAECASADERLILFTGSNLSWPERSESIESSGGKVRHGFPGGGAIVEADEQTWEKSLADGKNRWTVFSGAVEPSTLTSLSREGRTAAFVWNRRFEQAPSRAAALASERIPNDQPGGDAGYAPRGTRPAGKVPAGANFYDTSEYMLGEVAVAILMPESNGEIDPSTEDWTQGLIDTLVAEIQGGLDWWVQHAPGGNLSFIYELPDPIPTPYEPINNGAFTYARLETLWTPGLFDTLGHHTGDAFYKARSYLNEVRDTLAVDWAVAAIVVNSRNDPDGRFVLPYNFYGFSYYGGPYLVVTSDVGSDGIDNVDAVFAHELGHSFYALDEYTGGSPPCATTAGYEQVANENKEGGGCALDIGCLMKHWVSGFAGDSLCIYTAGQVGMHDDDFDDIPNILDTYPTSVLDPIADTLGYYTPTVTGTAFVNPLPNLNAAGEGNDITVNTIGSVEYRIDGGTWTAAEASDGLFDDHGEAFTFTTPALSETLHIIETRAINVVSNAETTYAVDTLFIYDGVAPGAVTEVAAAAFDSSVVLSWLNPADADLQSVMIRFSTTAVPADTSVGTLVELRAAIPFARDTLIVAGLFPDTTYYYSLFAVDEVPNPSPPASISAEPLYPPPPGQLYEPAAAALYVFHKPTFVWSPVVLGETSDTLTTYGIQIATDSLFLSPVIDLDAAIGSPADTFWTAADSLAPGTPYWWRIRGKDLLSDTYGYWSEGSSFTTELPLISVEYIDSTLSSYSNFASGDTLVALVDALVEVRFNPADTLGIAGYSGWLHWNSSTWDSTALLFDRNEGSYGYWNATISYGSSFNRGETVQFFVSGKDPNGPPIISDKGGELYSFTAGLNPLVSHHVPISVEPASAPMRTPLNVIDTDPAVTLSVGTAPAGSITGGEIRYHYISDTLFASAPLVLDTLAGGVDYYSASIESSFIYGSTVEYYARVWGGADFDTTYVFGDDNTSLSSLALADALAAPFSFFVESATGVTGSPVAAIPERNTLRSNTPNPFNPSTTISFGLSKRSRVRLEVFDIAGRRVTDLIDDLRDAGWHEVVWNGRAGSGEPVASGVYFYRIATEGWTDTRRMILIR